jgi:hypothetical protein
MLDLYKVPGANLLILKHGFTDFCLCVRTQYYVDIDAECVIIIWAGLYPYGICICNKTPRWYIHIQVLEALI